MLAYGTLGFMVYVVVFAVIQRIILLKNNFLRPRTIEPPGHYIFLGLSVVLFFGAVVSSNNNSTIYPAVIFIGYTMVVIGLGLSIWSHLTLGENWMGGIGLAKGHKLVTNGPYRSIRHPLYTGIMLSSLGLAIAGLNVIFFFSMVFFGAAYAIRAYSEEKLMEKAFKRQHQRYKKTTGLFLPRLRK